MVNKTVLKLFAYFWIEKFSCLARTIKFMLKKIKLYKFIYRILKLYIITEDTSSWPRS